MREGEEATSGPTKEGEEAPSDSPKEGEKEGIRLFLLVIQYLCPVPGIKR